MPRKSRKSRKSKPQAGSKSRALVPVAMRSTPSERVRYSNQGVARGSSKISFSSGTANGSDLVITGCEVSRDLQCNNVYNTTSFGINPASILFPRLNTMSKIFEEFYIRSLTVEYVPACPTTRSGSVSMCIDYDARDAPPTSVIELMANTSAFTCGVGERASLSFQPGAQRTRWYYVATPALVSDPQNLRQICPGMLHVLMSNSTSSDAGLIAGYIRVSYSMEFRTLRPPKLTYQSATSPKVGLTVASGGGVLPLTYQAGEGVSGLESDSTLSRGVPGDSLRTQRNSLLIGAGKYAISLLASWLGISAKLKSEEKSDKSESPILVHAPVRGTWFNSLNDEKKDESKAIALVPKKLGNDPTYVRVWFDHGVCYGELPDGQVVVIPPNPPEFGKMSPQTAGDYAVYVQLCSMYDGSVTNIVSDTGNNSSAFALQNVVELTSDGPYAVNIWTNNADTRGLAIFDLDVVTRSADQE